MSPDGAVIEHAVKLGFEASNNEAEYEALLAGLRNTHLLGTRHLLVFCDSKLVISQLKGEYAARNDCMAAYMKAANSLLAKFDHHELNQITRDQNTHADALACQASAINFEIKRTIEVGFISEPSIGPSEEIHVNVIESAPSWMDPIAAFLSSEQLPEEKKEAQKLRNKALRYYLDLQEGLYKKSLSGPYLECVHPDKMEELLTEIHEGSCGAHSGGCSLAHRAIT